MFHIAGIIISLFLVLLLATKKGKSTADFILATWLVIISFHLLAYYLLTSGYFVKFPFLLGFEIPVPLIHGPFLYLYIAALTNQRSRTLPWFIHFIPAIAAYILLVNFYSLPYSEQVSVYQNNGVGYERLLSIIRFPIIPSGVIYVIGSLILLRKHSKNISAQFSHLEKINLNWIIYLTAGMGSIWLSIIFRQETLTFILVDLFILFIGYFGIKQVGIFSDQSTENTSDDNLNDTEINSVDSLIKGSEKIKYQTTLLDNEVISKVHMQLSLLMENEKLYTDPELKLDELAKRLAVNGNTLSQVINSVEQRNFYDYINHLRINEFKRMVTLPENSRFTLLSIAFEAGFNSKTSFNRNFKKATGLSPKAYCQQEKIRLAEQGQVKETTLPFGTSSI
ncbi:helix-turn-helix domain-containing protein [Mucilaginibacter sp. KACC 22063]|uniref:helix-turn-helix domain-containing protein n=1 Tax=Mucilaginibacter sp. KACC 22063 TaxID=3025666 RepID=UPI0023660A49|nr:helix-turn-helix domain-containing protein [Mucilaginibacter sp. KACC 22063]WDF53892.1 helix-turn-helix domain-containing protein [Mucilaginibacter sp. KACC 22063]